MQIRGIEGHFKGLQTRLKYTNFRVEGRFQTGARYANLGADPGANPGAGPS